MIAALALAVALSAPPEPLAGEPGAAAMPAGGASEVGLALRLPPPPDGTAAAPRGGVAAAQDWGGDWDDDPEDRKRLFIAAWGGRALGTGGSGSSSSLLGGEVAWAFRSIELGLAGYAYRGLREEGPEWAPVTLLRFTQRFPTRGGLEAGLTFGVGAGKPDDWTAWYQIALGGRLPLGPLFLTGEVGFEQYDLVRLAAGIGAAL